MRFLWRFILMPLLFTLIGTIINFSTLSSTTIQKACSLVFAGQLPSDGAASVVAGNGGLAESVLCVWPRHWRPCAGLGVRMVTTLLVMKTSHFSWLECVWFAIAWTPKVPAGRLHCTSICGSRFCISGIQLASLGCLVFACVCDRGEPAWGAQATVQAALGQLPSDAVARAYPVGSPNHDRYTQYGTDALTTAVFEIIISGTLGSLMVRWLSPLLLKPVRPMHMARDVHSRSGIPCRHDFC